MNKQRNPPLLARCKWFRELFCLAAVIAFAICAAHAAAGGAQLRPCMLETQTSNVSLARCAARMIDDGGELGIEDVSSPDKAARFEPLGGFRSGGFDRGAHWYRLTVQRAEHAPADWILEMGAAFLDDVRVFAPDGAGGYRETRLGDHVPRNQKPIDSRLHSAPVAISTLAPIDLYVRVASTSSLVFNARMWQPAAFLRDERRSNFIHVMYFGMLATVALFYAAWSIMLRDRSLALYASFVACMLLFHFSVNGFVAMVPALRHPWLQDYFTEAGVLSVTFTATLVWDSFVEYKRNFPRLRFLYVAMLIINACCLLAIGSSYYGAASQVSNYLTLAFSLLSIALLIVLLRRRWDCIIFVYVVAFALPAVSGVVQLAMIEGLIERNWLTGYVYQVASTFHILLLSFALMLRIRKMQAEKRLAEQEAVVSARVADEQRKVVAMLSHEFRSPLAAIDRAAQMVEINNPGFSDATRERMQRIRAHTVRMAGLVDVFLTSEALAHGRLALKAEPMDVSALLLQLRRRFQEEEDGGRLVTRDGAAGAVIIADGELLGVALGNIVENAFRYSPVDAPVELRTRVERRSLSIEVADRGAGMAADEIDKIGAFYFRGQSSSGITGSGLGLYIAKRIIHAHGGRIDIASRPGEGTIFTVALRVVRQGTHEAD